MLMDPILPMETHAGHNMVIDQHDSGQADPHAGHMLNHQPMDIEQEREVRNFIFLMQKSLDVSSVVIWLPDVGDLVTSDVEIFIGPLENEVLRKLVRNKVVDMIYGTQFENVLAFW